MAGWRFGGRQRQAEQTNPARLVVVEPLQWRVEGPLTMQTVLALRWAGEAALTALPAGQGGTLMIDGSGVQQSDSAGLALLLSWQRAALAGQITLDCRGFPSHLHDIAALCGLPWPGAGG